MAMNRERVLMAVPIDPKLQETLAGRFNLLRLWEQPELLKNAAQGIRALVVDPTFEVSRAVLGCMPSLEIVATFSVGLDKIDRPACKARGVAVAFTPDVVTDDTADLAIALILSTLRRLCAADRYVRQKLWPVHGPFPLANKVSGKRVGIVGLGRIGSAIATRLSGFGCTISYYGRTPKPDVPYAYYGSVSEVARDSDVLVVACALCKETVHLINREVLEALGPAGTLVNIARGPIVDEVELVKALADGRLGAAGLDVFEGEPQVPEQLLGMDNVVLLPHVGTGTFETREEMMELVVGNLEAHFAGKPLLTPVPDV